MSRQNCHFSGAQEVISEFEGNGTNYDATWGTHLTGLRFSSNNSFNYTTAPHSSGFKKIDWVLYAQKPFDQKHFIAAIIGEFPNSNLERKSS